MTAFDHVPRIRGRSLETLELRAQHARIVTQEVLAEPADEWANLRSGYEDPTIGNEELLRGIPMQTRGVGGTIRGTNPQGVVIGRDQRRLAQRPGRMA